MRRRALGSAGVAALLVVAGFAHVGCSKDNESLLLVSASTADNTVTGLTKLVVSCGGVMQTFDIKGGGLSTTAVEVGLYLPSGVTGSKTVVATAVSSTGQCAYSGSADVSLAKAGATVNATVVMNPTQTCPPGVGGRGGSGGTGGGGTGGTGGSGGAGGGGNSCTAKAQPAVGSPPAFACCIEYAQDTPENCDPTTGTEIDAVAFSPDGKTLVSAANTGNDVKVWAFDGHVLTDTGTVLQSDGWWSMAFSADGSRLAVAVTGGVDLWTTKTWVLNQPFLGSSNFFKGVAFTPDQTHLIAIDEDSGGGTGSLYLFSIGSPVPAATVALTDAPVYLAVSPKAVNGQIGVVVTYSDGFADVFNYNSNGTFSAPTNLVVDPGGSIIWSAAFDAAGTLLAMGDDNGAVHFWTFPLSGTAENGAEIAFGTANNDDSVYGISFSPNGLYLAAGGGFIDSDSNASIYSVASRAQLARANSSHDVTAIAFSPMGNAVAGGEISCGLVFMCTN